MTPSWYDVLDVDASASTDEIRDAWKSAIADLDPTDRRFRLLNQAAETLLDPAKRSAHDAALAADAAEDEGTAVAAAETAEPEPVRAPVLAVAEPPVAVALDKPHPPAPEGSVVSSTSRTWWQPPVWLILGVGIVALVLAVVAGLQFRQPSDRAVASDTRGAQTAAERASSAVLSYDYRDLDANQTAASAYLTPSFRKDYDQLFTLIKENAEAVKPVVTAQVIASGVQRVNTAGTRVSVLVFVNRPTINASTTTPRVYQDQVLMQMEKVDGEWLVDDMITTPAAQ